VDILGINCGYTSNIVVRCTWDGKDGFSNTLFTHTQRDRNCPIYKYRGLLTLQCRARCNVLTLNPLHTADEYESGIWSRR